MSPHARDSASQLCGVMLVLTSLAVYIFAPAQAGAAGGALAVGTAMIAKGMPNERAKALRPPKLRKL